VSSAVANVELPESKLIRKNVGKGIKRGKTVYLLRKVLWDVPGIRKYMNREVRKGLACKSMRSMARCE